jgi:hypothetical protein
MSLCECGCGGVTPIASQTDARRGYQKGQHQRYLRYHNAPSAKPPQTPDAALDKYLTPGGPADCWEWQASRSPRGYGKVKIKGRELRAHRVAYEAAKGPIPTGLIVRHTCDNPPCCNPAHLLVGTSADNSADMLERRRQLLGEQVDRAKLTAQDVVEIRARYAAGERCASIARDFPVGWSAIKDVVRRATWAHVEDVAS